MKADFVTSYRSPPFPKTLQAIQLSAEQEAVVRDRLRDIVKLHIERMSAMVAPAEQMADVALDGYVQGLIDGSQLHMEGKEK